MKETNMGKYLEVPDGKLGRCQGWPAPTLHDLSSQCYYESYFFCWVNKCYIPSLIWWYRYKSGLITGIQHFTQACKHEDRVVSCMAIPSQSKPSCCRIISCWLFSNLSAHGGLFWRGYSEAKWCCRKSESWVTLLSGFWSNICLLCMRTEFCMQKVLGFSCKKCR